MEMDSGSSPFRRGSGFVYELIPPTQRQACRRLRGDTPHQFACSRCVADEFDVFADRYVCSVLVPGIMGGFDFGQCPGPGKAQVQRWLAAG